MGTPGPGQRHRAEAGGDPIAKSQIVVVQGGTNTINSGDRTGMARPAGSAYVIAQFDPYLRNCRNAGRWVVLEALLPRGDWPADDPLQAALAETNAWIREQKGRDGIVGIWDSWDVLAPGGALDPSTFLEGSTGVHRNQKGAHASALLGSNLLARMFGATVLPGLCSTPIRPSPTCLARPLAISLAATARR